MKYQLAVCSFVSVLIGGVLPAHAGVVGVAGGGGNPAATLGPYTMTPFVNDTGAARSYASSLDSPLGGSLDFSSALERVPVSTLEAYWSETPANDYTGMTYVSTGNNGVTLTMPSNTVAFYLYVIPDSYATPQPITVTAQDGTSVTQIGQSNVTGASYFGFYATGGDLITSLTVSVAVDEETSPVFLIGQFGIAASSVPEPAGAVLLGLGALGLAGFVSRRRSIATIRPAPRLDQTTGAA